MVYTKESEFLLDSATKEMILRWESLEKTSNVSN